MSKEFSYKAFFYSLIGIIMILFILSIKDCSAQIPKDKQLHFGSGAVISAWSYLVGQNTKPVIFGITGAAIAGIGKESLDKIKGGKFDTKDLGYTILGDVISVGIITVVKKIKPRKKHCYYGFIKT